MLVVGYLSYTATESRIVQIRISDAWVLYTSDLKRPKTVQVTEKEQFNSREWNVTFCFNKAVVGIETIFPFSAY